MLVDGHYRKYSSLPVRAPARGAQQCRAFERIGLELFAEPAAGVLSGSASRILTTRWHWRKRRSALASRSRVARSSIHISSARGGCGSRWPSARTRVHAGCSTRPLPSRDRSPLRTPDGGNAAPLPLQPAGSARSPRTASSPTSEKEPGADIQARSQKRQMKPTSELQRSLHCSVPVPGQETRDRKERSPKTPVLALGGGCRQRTERQFKHLGVKFATRPINRIFRPINEFTSLQQPNINGNSAA
jgi:hypothetical protein